MPTLPERPNFGQTAIDASRSTFDIWLRLWDWVLASLEAKGWPRGEVVLEDRVSASDIAEYETAFGRTLTENFKSVLMDFAGGATLSIPLPNKNSPQFAEWDQLQSSGSVPLFGRETQIWSFSTMLQSMERFFDYCDCYDGEESELGDIFKTTIPITVIDNGDFVALDTANGAVIYLAKALDLTMMGRRLGSSFTDYVTRMAWAGSPWPDFLPVSELYDQRNQLIACESQFINGWHAWLVGER